MTTPHKHAALIKQWADDPSQQVWAYYIEHPTAGWLREAVPAWVDTAYYALGPKPTQPPRKMCSLAGVEFPVPETVALPTTTPSHYFVASPEGTKGQYRWVNDHFDKTSLAAGVVHLTYSAAEQHSKALLAANKQAIEAARD